ncbi:MAG: FAD-dependent oxidoreductase [Kiritimatiellia bacterium]
MTIQIPILDTVDFLFVGAPLPAVSLATELSKQNKKVFVGTPWTFLGEDICATLRLSDTHTKAFQTILGHDRFATLREIKAAADAALIAAKVPFLFQMRPIAPMRDATGRICGVLFGDRTGFQAVQAKVVIDSTPFATFARSAGIRFSPVQPGAKHVTAHFLGTANPAGDACRITTEIPEIRDNDRTFPLVRVEADVTFTGTTPREIADTLNRFRIQAFHPHCVEAPEEIEIEWNSRPTTTPSAECPVFVGVPSTDEALALLAETSSSLPVSFGPFPGEHIRDNATELVRVGQYPRFGNCPTIPLDLNAFPLLDSCDVFVAGAGTGGAPAAISAGRAGASTICAENLSILGGLMTVGRIGNYWFGRRVGFAKEGDEAVYAIEPGNRNNNREGGSYNGDWRAAWFLQEAVSAGVSVFSQTLSLAALVRKAAPHDLASLCGVLVATPYGTGIIRTNCVVDATGNGDIADAAGARALDTLKDEPAVQGAGVSPIQPGISYTNNDFTFVLDSDVVDATRSFVTAHARYTHFDTASILGTRERRRILGDIVLHPVDFYAGRTYADTVCVAESNFDTHGYTLSPLFMVAPPTHDPRTADIPLRALTPADFDRLLVTGLSVSADRDAMPLIRMQADVQNQGFAAGLIAAASSLSNTAIRSVPLRPIQQKLVDLGLLPERVLSDRDHIPEATDADQNTITARLFANPKSAIPLLRNRLEQNSDDLVAAQMLAFLSDDSGRTTLVRSLDKPWDDGWNYTGMGQFGRSVSPMDVSLLALSNIGISPALLLKKLSTLTMAHAFSHIRSVALVLLKTPLPEAAPELERLLKTPGASGHAITSLEQALASNRPEYNDTTLRNDQLRELYVARALHACKPDCKLAADTLAAYREGMQGAYIPFATV